MRATVRFFHNTGFNSVNIPDSKLLLNNYRYTDVDAIYVKQQYGLESIKVSATVDILSDVDYCVIDDVYYYVTGTEMINDNMCLVGLLEDALTTIGLDTITIMDGQCTRRCVVEDNDFGNVIPEAFTPSEPLVNRHYVLGGDDSHSYTYDDYYVFIASTVNLLDTELLKAKNLQDPDVPDSSVTYPNIQTISNETKICVQAEDGSVLEGYYPSVGLYLYSRITNGEEAFPAGIGIQLIRQNVQNVRSLGVDGCIVGCYRVPASMIDAEKSIIETGFVEKITSAKAYSAGFVGLEEEPALSYRYGNHIMKNKKIYSLFNDITIYSKDSGELASYAINNIYSEENERPMFTYSIDPGPTGKTYLRPEYFLGEKSGKDTMLDNTISSSGWLNAPINFTNPSGSAIDAYNAMSTRAIMQTQYDEFVHNNMGWRNIWTRGLYSAASQISPFEGLFTSVQRTGGLSSEKIANKPAGGEYSFGMLSSMLSGHEKERQRANNEYSIQRQNEIMRYQIDKERIAYESSQVIAPAIKFSQAPSSQMYYGPTFFAVTTRLSDGDLERFDNYLTRFGYAVNEVLTKECFEGRENFNFVEAVGVKISSASKYSSLSRRQRAEAQLSAGVRIWHTTPSIEKLNNNPIVTQ